MSKVVCPVCGSNLIYHRMDDSRVTVEINSMTEVTELTNDSNGNTRVYCSKHSTHKIPDDLWAEVEKIVDEFYYY